MTSNFTKILIIWGCILTIGCSNNNNSTGPRAALASAPVVTESLNPTTLATIHSIAVMPIAGPSGEGEELFSLQRGALNRVLSSALTKKWHGKIKSGKEVADRISHLRGRPPRQISIDLASRLSVDAVLFSQVGSYVERVGSSIGGDSGAKISISFVLYDGGSGLPIWQGSYFKDERPLSENILNIGNVVKDGIAWHKVFELAKRGIAETVNKLSSDAKIEGKLTQIGRL